MRRNLVFHNLGASREGGRKDTIVLWYR